MGSMKKTELRKCAHCDKGMAHNREMMFYTVEISQYLLDPNKIQQEHGLELMMGGGQQGAALADITGPNPDIAQEMSKTQKIFLCMKCALGESQIIPLLSEKANESNTDSNSQS